MKVKELIEHLSEFSPDADVSIMLDGGGAVTKIDDFFVEMDMDNAAEDAASSTVAYLYEVVPENDTVFDEHLRLGIPAEFVDLCEQNYTTPREVLHGFIADLSILPDEDDEDAVEEDIPKHLSGPRKDRLRSNGGDERALALQYFRRCGYRYRHKY